MVEIHQTDVFERWLRKLQDTQAKAKILIRIKRLELGNPGDTKPVGGGVSELRINTGPGYRVYFVQRGGSVVVLLVGGEKSSQGRDIKRARKLASKL